MFSCAHLHHRHPPTPSKKIYLARRDNGLYCDVKEACIYKKKQRRSGCRSWRTLIRLSLSFPIHRLYQWHSSSSAFVHDRDQIDFRDVSGCRNVLEREWLRKLWLDSIFLCSFAVSQAVCLANTASHFYLCGDFLRHITLPTSLPDPNPNLNPILTSSLKALKLCGTAQYLHNHVPILIVEWGCCVVNTHLDGTY